MSIAPDKVDDAIIWLTAHWFDCGRPLIPVIRHKFGLTPKEAIDVLRAASDAVRQSRGARD